jgi:hypothetical protein|tara:strand:- start:986 stop:1198 length:213 start_codon:yes stop_codon:yes gene_type:complete
MPRKSDIDWLFNECIAKPKKEMELKTRQSFTDWVLQGQEDYENELLDSGFDSDDIDLIIEKRGNYDNSID